jgi:hypothetical protein
MPYLNLLGIYCVRACARVRMCVCARVYVEERFNAIKSLSNIWTTSLLRVTDCVTRPATRRRASAGIRRQHSIFVLRVQQPELLLRFNLHEQSQILT